MVRFNILADLIITPYTRANMTHHGARALLHPCVVEYIFGDHETKVTEFLNSPRKNQLIFIPTLCDSTVGVSIAENTLY
jgi:hypothetical protein